MEIPKNAIELAKKFEGFSNKPYVCPGGFWTIGYGHRCESDHPEITEEEGLEFLKQDMESAVKSTLLYCPILSEDEERLGAIADFVFNLGSQRLKESTLRIRINEGNWPEAANAKR